MAQLGWPPASYLPISASPVLRLQAWVIAPGFRGSDLGPLASWTELTPQLLVTSFCWCPKEDGGWSRLAESPYLVWLVTSYL